MEARAGQQEGRARGDPELRARDSAEEALRASHGPQLAHGPLHERRPVLARDDLGDALDFMRRVKLRVDGAFFAVFERHDFLRLAEVRTARQLTQDEDVEAFHVLTPQARGLGEGRITNGRPQVGK